MCFYASNPFLAIQSQCTWCLTCSTRDSGGSSLPDSQMFHTWFVLLTKFILTSYNSSGSRQRFSLLLGAGHLFDGCPNSPTGCDDSAGWSNFRHSLRTCLPAILSNCHFLERLEGLIFDKIILKPKF